MKKHVFTFICIFLFWSIAVCSAQNGILDASFGTDGKVITDFGAGSWEERAIDVAAQDDGKIVVLGYSSSRVVAARYEADGTLDETFGSFGRVITDVIKSGSFTNRGAIAIQNDGKIVIATDSEETDTGETDFVLVRLKSDGSLDDSFGVGGIAKTDVDSSDHPEDIAIQNDGKILVAGGSSMLSGRHVTVLRYNTDGSPDPSFSLDGKAVLDFEGWATSVIPQTDGKIVLTGKSSTLAVIRLQSDGSPDLTFNSSGIVRTGLGENLDEGGAGATQADGKIIISGKSVSGKDEFALIRYNADGTINTSFGDNGQVITDLSSLTEGAEASGVVIQPDEKIVVGGGSGFILVRYNLDGSLDSTFGNDGIASFGTDEGRCEAIAIQPDGKLIAVGASDNSSDFVIARYTGSSASNKRYVSGRLSIDFAGHLDLGIADATVSLTNSQYSTQSDSSGNFTLAVDSDLAQGDHTLSVTSSDLKTETIDITFNGDNISVGDVTMEIDKSGMYTQADLDQAVLNERLKWDANNDNQIGLEEAVNALKVVSDVK